MLAAMLAPACWIKIFVVSEVLLQDHGKLYFDFANAA